MYFLKRSIPFDYQFFLVLFTALLSSTTNGSPPQKNPYRHRATLDPQSKYQLEYEVDWTQNRVIFNVSVETTGWIGFGLSKKGKMENSDLVIGGVDSRGRSYFSDRHIPSGSRVLERDPSQDWILHRASENRSHTFLSFSRPFETCDEEHDLPISDDLLSLIWAYGEEEDDNESQAHFQNRGSFDAFLLDPVHSRPTGGSNRVFNITEEMVVPEREVYWCHFHKVPTRTKQHIVGFNPILPTEETRRHIHHFLLFRCVAPQGVNPDALFGPASRSGGRECYVQVEPNSVEGRHCQEIVYGFAVGGKETFFADHVGVPMSETGTEYFLMQIHYNNPNQIPNIRIRSTLEIHYTSDLREHDVGVMSVGMWTPAPTTIFLPPNSREHHVIGHCAPDCTRSILPSEGINIIAVLAHTHGTGRASRTYHFRGQKELPWLINDDNYKFAYQQFRMLRQERKVLPGDQLSTRCIYDTTEMNGSVITGGFPTRQEMCDAVIYYYNRIPGHSICLSQIRTKEYFDFLGVGNVTWNDQRKESTITSPPEFSGLTMTEYGNQHVNWNVAKRNELQRLHLTQPHVSQCPSNIPEAVGSTQGAEFPAVFPTGVERYTRRNQCNKIGKGSRWGWGRG